MKVLFLPFTKSNPYQQNLSDALRTYGIDVLDTHKTFPSAYWLLKNRRKVPILHIHWPHSLYRYGARTKKRAIAVFVRLWLSYILGYKFVWTMHNLVPHETPDPWIDGLARKILVVLSQHIFVHCHYARVELQKTFRRRSDTTIIPHGNFGACYPNGIGKLEARKRLNIESRAFTYLFFGKIRPYKNIHKLITAFNQIKGDNSLIIAGHCAPHERERLESLSKNNNNISIFPYFVSDRETPLFFSAADAFVVPFSNVLTSGSVILSLSYGLPVIAPAAGCLPELLARGGGTLYNPNSQTLSAAMVHIKSLNRDKLRHQAVSIAAGLSWEKNAEKTARVYHRLVEGSN